MRPIDIVRKVAPHAKPEYLAAFEAGDEQFRKAGITTPIRMAHFLAQTLEETGGYTIFTESGNYSAQRMHEVWPSRFPTATSGLRFEHKPEALFNEVYANRMGNGPPSSGDGYRYRGRGPLQTTGKDAYAKYGKLAGADFVNHPELIIDPRYMLQPALAEWVAGGCNAMADANDLRAITKRINGGYTNIKERERWFGVVRPIIDKVDLVAGPSPPVDAPKPAEVPVPPPKPSPAPAPFPVPPVPPPSLWSTIWRRLTFQG